MHSWSGCLLYGPDRELRAIGPTLPKPFLPHFTGVGGSQDLLGALCLFLSQTGAEGKPLAAGLGSWGVLSGARPTSIHVPLQRWLHFSAREGAVSAVSSLPAPADPGRAETQPLCPPHPFAMRGWDNMPRACSARSIRHPGWDGAKQGGEER